MTSHKDQVIDKIDEMAKSTKAHVEHAIDDVKKVASHATEKAGQHLHDAGEKVKEVGEKIMKAAE